MLAFPLFLLPVKAIKKAKMLKILISISYYRKLFANECKKCELDIRVYSPLSIKGLKYVSIGKNFKIDVGGIIEAWDSHNEVKYSPTIIIGDNVSLGKNCHIGCINEIRIDDNVLIGSNVLIIDHNHGLKDFSDISIPPNNRRLSSSGPIHIKKNVWIGEKVSILAGVTIGENTIIGANSVVTSDIPQNCVACGVPARVIKQIESEE